MLKNILLRYLLIYQPLRTNISFGYKINQNIENRLSSSMIHIKFKIPDTPVVHIKMFSY